MQYTFILAPTLSSNILQSTRGGQLSLSNVNAIYFTPVFEATFWGVTTNFKFGSAA